jgi:hypothetical protein
MDKIILRADDGKYVTSTVNKRQNGLYASANMKEEAITLEIVNRDKFVLSVIKSKQFGLNVSSTTDVGKKTGTILDGFGTKESKRVLLRKGSEYVALDGTYLVFVPDINKAVYFEMADGGSNQIAFKAANGKFVSRYTLGSNMLMANRDVLGPWETFTVE